MTTPLKILFTASEIAPLIKTGGLADVAHALPKTLRAMGHDVRLAMPAYGAIPEERLGTQVSTCVAELAGGEIEGALRTSTLPGTDIPLYLVEHDAFFSRDAIYTTGGQEFEDNLIRYSFFSLALLDGIEKVGWKPDLIHCNDWHTAGIPAYIKTRYARNAFWKGTATLFTIHNLAYQGRYPAWQLPETGLGWELFTPECMEFYGDLNLMKGAVDFASRVNTVSKRYAKEIQTPEYGYGLDGFLRKHGDKLSGILNGVDYSEWHPEQSPHLPAKYSADDPSGKAICKTALQKQFNLPQRDDVPLIGMVCRFDWQKGLDMVAEALPALVERDLQLVFLGTGDEHWEAVFETEANKYPEKIAVALKYDAALAHQIHAGTDFFLMPSHFEPSGLSQLYSLAFGCIPIVRKTGGLADSIHDATQFNVERGRATGIVFASKTHEALTEAVVRALRLYEDQDLYLKIRDTGMAQNFSWDQAAEEYVRLYEEGIAHP
jgi:starch synthase